MKSTLNIAKSKLLAFVAWFRSGFKDKWRVIQVCAILLIAASSAYAIDSNRRDTDRQVQDTLSSQRAGCKRTNEFRAQINMQNKSVLARNDVTLQLFSDIGDSSEIPDDLKRKIGTAVKKYESVSTGYKPLQTIDCVKAYPSKSR